MRRTFLPVARQSDKLTVQELGTEMLVYDCACHKIYYLSPSTSIVWKHCDGKSKKDDIARILSREMNVSDGRDELNEALGRLQRYHLI
jgi:hypothetical protein